MGCVILKEGIEGMFNNKTILITGGTGSFGHKFATRLLAEYNPKKIIIFSRDELKQYEMAQRPEFKGQKSLRFFIGDVRDYDRLTVAMRGVDYVFHAAALKQVPSCEFFPMEAVKTNVLGTNHVLDAGDTL